MATRPLYIMIEGNPRRGETIGIAIYLLPPGYPETPPFPPNRKVMDGIKKAFGTPGKLSEDFLAWSGFMWPEHLAEQPETPPFTLTFPKTVKVQEGPHKRSLYLPDATFPHVPGKEALAGKPCFKVILTPEFVSGPHEDPQEFARMEVLPEILVRLTRAYGQHFMPCHIAETVDRRLLSPAFLQEVVLAELDQRSLEGEETPSSRALFAELRNTFLAEMVGIFAIKKHIDVPPTQVTKKEFESYSGLTLPPGTGRNLFVAAIGELCAESLRKRLTGQFQKNDTAFSQPTELSCYAGDAVVQPETMMAARAAADIPYPPHAWIVLDLDKMRAPSVWEQIQTLARNAAEGNVDKSIGTIDPEVNIKATASAMLRLRGILPLANAAAYLSHSVNKSFAPTEEDIADLRLRLTPYGVLVETGALRMAETILLPMLEEAGYGISEAELPRGVDPNRRAHYLIEGDDLIGAYLLTLECFHREGMLDIARLGDILATPAGGKAFADIKQTVREEARLYFAANGLDDLFPDFRPEMAATILWIAQNAAQSDYVQDNDGSAYWRKALEHIRASYPNERTTATPLFINRMLKALDEGRIAPSVSEPSEHTAALTEVERMLREAQQEKETQWQERPPRQGEWIRK